MMQKRKFTATAIWLRQIGDYVEVLVEQENQWKLVIREFAGRTDCTFSHITETAGVEAAPLDELTSLGFSPKSMTQPQQVDERTFIPVALHEEQMALAVAGAYRGAATYAEELDDTLLAARIRQRTPDDAARALKKLVDERVNERGTAITEAFKDSIAEARRAERERCRLAARGTDKLKESGNRQLYWKGRMDASEAIRALPDEEGK